ncbi:MAG: radical SAM protein [Bacteroidota bacterium]
MIAFGPIPSRRLGVSLGINNIPGSKTCSYSCVYCQVGASLQYSITRRLCYAPELILSEVEKLLNKTSDSVTPDYLTFVANGEPTLDINLGKAILLLKSLGIPVAVITNASLLSNDSVCEDLCLADWVSVKADAADETSWRKINRPHKGIDFTRHLQGLLHFAKHFPNKLQTETMLAAGFNDQPEILENTAETIYKINPATAWISIPTRPPAVKQVKAPVSEIINQAYQIFSEKGIPTKLILGFEGTETGFTGVIEEDILNICAVHPIREDTMQELLKKNQADNSVLDKLLKEEKIQHLRYNNHSFYLRKHPKAI